MRTHGSLSDVAAVFRQPQASSHQQKARQAKWLGSAQQRKRVSTSTPCLDFWVSLRRKRLMQRVVLLGLQVKVAALSVILHEKRSELLERPLTEIIRDGLLGFRQ